MVIRMRHTRSHTKNRRSHHALKAVKFSVCSNCGVKVMPHIVCAACGYYRGVAVIEVAKKLKKEAKKKKEAKGKEEKEKSKSKVK